MVLTRGSMEFQSTICSSTLTPVFLVYVSASVCQNGRVWSLLYSAMTTLMAETPLAGPLAGGSRSQAVRARADRSRATTYRLARSLPPFVAVVVVCAAPIVAGDAWGSQQRNHGVGTGRPRSG